jgi:4-hydroxybutyryl-CoA dehydratase/vinylacetyl-CoA-Delta-isomerase
MPSEEDYSQEQIKEYMNKYLVGKATVPTEQRLRLFRLIEDLSLGEMGSWVLLSRLHGGGSPAAQKIMVLREYDMEESKKMVKRFLEM